MAENGSSERVERIENKLDLLPSLSISASKKSTSSSSKCASTSSSSESA